MKKHKFFLENTFDKTYTQLKKNKKLDWNEKALITHIINLQEKQSKRTGKQLVCTQSNTTIADNLGIPPSTLNKLITRLGKMKPKFFKAQPNPSRRPSGGYYNGTEKTIDMALLVKFLNGEALQQNLEEPAEEGLVNTIDSNVAPITSHGELGHGAVYETNALTSCSTKEVAFYKLTIVLEEDVPNIFIDTDEVIEFWLRNNLMARDDFSYQEKIEYAEWISHYMVEDYAEMKKDFQKLKAA